MIEIRPMTAADLALGMKLKAQAGWNQTEADWRRFLDLEPDGCFVALWDGRPAGTTTTCVFDSVAWIAMVLVDEPLRHRGIGTALVQHALAWLDRRGVAAARLDATPLGRPVYERLGFAAEYDLVRMRGTAPSGLSAHPQVRPVADGALEAVLGLDFEATGTDRRRLIRHLAGRQSGWLRVFARDGALGYAMSREGARAAQIGPAIALSDEAGRALGDAALAHCHGRPVCVDIPTDNAAAIGWAASRGLRVERPFTRMCRGTPVADHPERIWASSGPECG